MKWLWLQTPAETCIGKQELIFHHIISQQYVRKLGLMNMQQLNNKDGTPTHQLYLSLISMLWKGYAVQMSCGKTGLGMTPSQTLALTFIYLNHLLCAKYWVPWDRSTRAEQWVNKLTEIFASYPWLKLPSLSSCLFSKEGGHYSNGNRLQGWNSPLPIKMCSILLTQNWRGVWTGPY